MIKLYYKIVLDNRKTIMTYLSIFLVIFIVFGMFSSDVDTGTKTYEQKKPEIAVIDHDHSELSNIVTKQLKKENTVIESLTTMNDMKDALFFAQIGVIVEIPKDFQTKFEQGNANLLKLQQRPDASDGVIISQSINSFLSSIQSYKSVNASLSYKETQSLINKDLKQKATIKMTKEEKALQVDILRTMYYNFMSYVLFSVIVMTAGAAMHTIYRSEILKRTLVAPINTTTINLKVILANITFGLGLWAVFTIVIMALRGSMFSSSGLLLMANSLIFTLMSISFAYMITTIIANKKQARDKLDMICNIFGLAMAFLGGAFLPQEFVPESVLQIARFLPSYWYVKLNDSLVSMSDITKNVLSDSLTYMGIQLLFAITFIAIGLVIMKRKSSQDEIIDTDFE